MMNEGQSDRKLSLRYEAFRPVNGVQYLLLSHRDEAHPVVFSQIPIIVTGIQGNKQFFLRNGVEGGENGICVRYHGVEIG